MFLGIAIVIISVTVFGSKSGNLRHVLTDVEEIPMCCDERAVCSSFACPVNYRHIVHTVET
eukprot:451299-Amphidinium_carterae.1